MTSELRYVYEVLQGALSTQRREIDKLQRGSERSETAGGIASSTLAEAPLAVDGGMSNADLLFITDGCKMGESTGAGTGVPAYYNAATDQWFRFSDDTAVIT